MNSMDSVGRRGKLAEEQVLLSEIPARNGVMITPTRTSNGRKGELENIYKYAQNLFLTFTYAINKL